MHGSLLLQHIKILFQSLSILYTLITYTLAWRNTHTHRPTHIPTLDQSGNSKESQNQRVPHSKCEMQRGRVKKNRPKIRRRSGRGEIPCEVWRRWVEGRRCCDSNTERNEWERNSEAERAPRLASLRWHWSTEWEDGVKNLIDFSRTSQLTPLSPPSPPSLPPSLMSFGLTE